jgi:hypothetical protein
VIALQGSEQIHALLTNLLAAVPEFAFQPQGPDRCHR